MPEHRRNILYVPIVAGLVFQPLTAQAEQDRFLSITAENDIYAPRGQDRHYTNGVRLIYGPGAAAAGAAHYNWLGALLGKFTPVTHPRYEVEFGQNIYTPEYDVYGNPASDDRPFAGWLYAGLSVHSQQPGHTDYLVINTGIVGPAALGRQAQNLIHNIVDDPELSGWEDQLDNEPGLLVRYRRSWFIPLSTGVARLELVPALGFSLGNVMTDAAAAISLQFGNQQTGIVVPARLEGEHAAAGSYFPVSTQQTRWIVFASVQQRAVLRNIFLDGNTFSDSVSVSKRTFVNDIITGFALGYGQFSIPIVVAFNLTFRGREFELQRGSNSFGSVTLSTQY
jgi:lipid A 3-O-deacylase